MSDRSDAEAKWWTELRRLAAEDRVAEFYQRYAEYLEWNNVLSPSRKAIHQMAIRAAELLKEPTR